VAAALIVFHEEWARHTSAPPEARTGGAAPRFQRYFIVHGRYTAALSVRYPSSNLIGAATHQDLAPGFPIGMRFHSAPVLRLADAKPMQLGHVQGVAARWFLCAFAGAEAPMQQLQTLCTALQPMIEAVTPEGADPDAVIDLRAILQERGALEITEMPDRLFPVKGALGLRDYEKVFAADPSQGDIYTMRGICRAGCLVLVRPDQYVAHILPLDGVADLTAFLRPILAPG